MQEMLKADPSEMSPLISPNDDIVNLINLQSLLERRHYHNYLKVEVRDILLIEKNLSIEKTRSLLLPRKYRIAFPSLSL